MNVDSLCRERAARSTSPNQRRVQPFGTNAISSVRAETPRAPALAIAAVAGPREIEYVKARDI